MIEKGQKKMTKESSYRNQKDISDGWHDKEWRLGYGKCFREEPLEDN
jgi:hypothetical protein